MPFRAGLSWCGLGAILFTLGCPPPPPPPDPIGARPLRGGEPPWLMLRVEAASVSTVRPGTQAQWDPAPDPHDGAECGLLGLNAAPSQPVFGKGADVLCQFDSRPRSERRDPSAPDLIVLLSAGGATYQTYTAWDSVSHAFHQAEFVIPVGAISPDGLFLTVRDRDGVRYEDIGTRRLTREHLVRTALSSSPRIALGDPRSGLPQLDVSVYPYVPVDTSALAGMDARAGMIAAPIRPIRGGEIVEITARGQYRTGSYLEPWTGPNGYSAENPVGFNFENEPFQLTPHAAAITLVGNGDSRAGMVVAYCVRFISTVGGPLVLGINDAEPRNNQGQLAFTIRVVSPSPEEWWHGQTGPCQ